MRKRGIIFFVIFTMIISMAACGKNNAKSAENTVEAVKEEEKVLTQETKEEPDSTDNVAESKEYTVTDILGREVEIPAQINTIASINGAARMLVYAQATDKLVGVTDMDKSNVAEMPYSVVGADKFANLQSVGSGGSGDTVYVEELVTLNPDLIFAFTTDVEALDELQAQTGIPVVGLYAKEVFDETFYQTLELIGQIMGTKERCEYVTKCMKEWDKDLNNRTADIKEEEKPTVYTGAVSFRGGHGFEGTYGAYPPFDAINAKNVVDETNQEGPMLIDLEKISIWDPDIIFINPGSLNLVNENYETNSAFYENLTAVKNGQVYTQIAYNYNWCNMELAMVDAYYAGTVIYPNEFSNISFEQKAEEIFNVMLGQDYLGVLENAGIGFEKILIGK